MSGGVELHWSLGPVQGFVAEARRARDLWAGSFLLSWLAMRALAVMEDAGGEILRPLGLEQDDGYQALRAGGGVAPYQATVPNRLTAAFADEDAAVAAADTARLTVLGAWETLAGKVREEFLDGVLDAKPGGEQRAIWDAAIGPPNRLWEIHWVVVPACQDGQAALDRRKLWRDFETFPPEVAGGDRCRLMHDWPELSGASRVTGPGREAQAAFWERVHAAYCVATDEKADGRRLELRDGERLSAPALVKRLFPRLSIGALEQAIGWRPSEGVTEKGRWRPSYMPSTAYMAAVHWLARAARVDRMLCDRIARKVSAESLALGRAERQTELAVLMAQDVGPLREVDGTLFYAETLESAQEIGLDETVCRQLAEMLRQLYATKDEQDQDRPLGAPSPYYAMLRMDGDRMGPRLRDNEALAQALPRFAQAARGIVEGHSGRLLYAGGDDLLALLPLEEAIAAALALEQEFTDIAGPLSEAATISAGLVFAHQNAPLRAVLAESERLLNDIAKEVNGRASLAVSVFRVGGPAFEWATTWRDQQEGAPVDRLQRLLERLYCPTAPTRALASNRLAYAMRDRLGPYFTEPGLRRQQVVTGKEELRAPLEVVAGLVRSVGGEALGAIDDKDLGDLLDVAVIRFRVADDRTAPPTLIDDQAAERCLDLFLLFRFLGSQWRKR